MLWGYLSQPSYRSVIVGAERVALENRKAGRMAPGSQLQRFHGRHMLCQMIVEWTPFEWIVTQDTETMPLLSRLTWRNQYRLVATDTGAHMTISLGGFEGPWLPRKVAMIMLSRGGWQIKGNLREFAAMAEADWAQQPAGPGDASTIEPTEQLIREGRAPA